ncbi:FUSC family protein [Ancylobacter amanitiformis]|uniref:Membrane protein YccC n=1 Tax=Ancylobacter amanitiformis TaxID=217069 RepID=A0ABU0LRP5_9HYPH|nr:FUSC family protein [Ancylobacter amanitiformis]MDQ0511382.1 putative membrane protein YccC [Ancylobacter amanitiformis]
MSVAETARPEGWRPFPIDLNWRNWVFALRTALAGVTALAIAYWLEMQDPQWAILTVYLLAQPTSGAALAKSAYRIYGTLGGAAMGLVFLALFAESGPPLVGCVALFVGLTFYLGARLANYAAYAFMLAGYTALLVALEGSADPMNAWSIAADRTGEIVIGIVCGTAATVLILPRYAGDALREQMAALFGRLCRYGAVALQPDMPFATFVALRREMVDAVVKFDALRSYAVFEAPELRADDVLLRRTLREFLRVLAVARGLFVRIDDFRVEGAGPVVEQVRPALEHTRATLERLAADPSAFADPHRVRRDLLAARGQLDAAALQLQAMAGTVPFAPLANGLLILRRAGDLLHGLSLVIVCEAASLRRRGRSHLRRPVEAMPAAARREAMLVGLRAALGVVLASAFWAASGWDQGFGAVTGLGLMLFFSVNQDRPGKLGLPVLIWSVLAIAAAYAAMVFVLPRLEGYGALAIFLVLVLLPGGLMAGTPAYVWQGIIFAGFLADQIGTGNLFQPDELSFFNGNLAFIAGMMAGLMLFALFPVTSQASRRRAWAAIVGRLLPMAARGERHERRVLGEIVDMLAQLLPRLSLDRSGDEDFLRGTLGAASCALELGRLHRLRLEPALPAEADETLARFLTRFAAVLETWPRAGARLPDAVAEAEATVATARAMLEALTLAPGSAAAALTVRAGASLRFIGDRFSIDRAILTRSFREA